MRLRVLALVIGCGLIGVTIGPALATCQFHATTASSDQAAQQTAQAQSQQQDMPSE